MSVMGNGTVIGGQWDRILCDGYAWSVQMNWWKCPPPGGGKRGEEEEEEEERRREASQPPSRLMILAVSGVAVAIVRAIVHAGVDFVM